MEGGTIDAISKYGNELEEIVICKHRSSLLIELNDWIVVMMYTKDPFMVIIISK